MAKLDLFLFILFGIACLLGLTGTALCLRASLKAAVRRDGELPMVFWAFGALACLVLAGMSAGYFLLPLIFHR